MSPSIARRQFLSLAAGSALIPSGAVRAEEKPVRVGIVGIGARGRLLLKLLLEMPAVEVSAICDIDSGAIDRALQLFQGRTQPEVYSRGEEDFRRLVDRSDLDAVINATPWAVHARVSLAALNAGKYVGTEVPAGLTLEECWELVNTSERTNRPCMLLENVNYYRNVLLILNMVRHGVFGEVIHCAGGYQHDVRALKLDQSGELRWRGREALTYNGNQYPTHAIGPIAWWMNINRGDRFTYLSSMSTVSRGVNHYGARKFGPTHPSATRAYAEGDVNTTLIKTAKGYTVSLTYATQASRPYDLGLTVQGTAGIYSGTLDKVYIEGEDPDGPEKWADLTQYYEKFEHPFWKGGALSGDALVLREFIKAVRTKTQTPIDVYDTATWSAIVSLSAESVRRGSSTVEFPDFTGGRWKAAQPVQFQQPVVKVARSRAAGIGLESKAGGGS